MASNVVLKDRWNITGIDVILAPPGTLFVLIGVHISFPALLLVGFFTFYYL